MNLTKTDKAAFVRAVMADVPRVDYNEKARALLTARERDKLELELGSLLAPFRTLAAAKNGLPEELHKYLPADRDATGVTNLPAVASTVDLLKAMGWPK